MRRRAALLCLGFAMTGCFGGIGPSIADHSRRTASLDPDDFSVRWLGHAGFAIRSGASTILLDPVVTRPSILGALLGRLSSDDAMRALVPKPDALFVSHAHFDHLLDAPALSAENGVTIYGSPSVCRASRAWVRGSQCQVMDGQSRITVGPFEVRALRGKHALGPTGSVPLEGWVEPEPKWSYPHMVNLPEGGGTLSFVIRVGDLRILHLASGATPDNLSRLGPIDLVLAAVPILDADVDFYVAEIRRLDPKVVVIHHHDFLLGPLEEPWIVHRRFERMKQALDPVPTVELRPFREVSFGDLDHEAFWQRVVNAESVTAPP